MVKRQTVVMKSGEMEIFRRMYYCVKEGVGSIDRGEWVHAILMLGQGWQMMQWLDERLGFKKEKTDQQKQELRESLFRAKENKRKRRGVKK